MAFRKLTLDLTSARADVDVTPSGLKCITSTVTKSMDGTVTVSGKQNVSTNDAFEFSVGDAYSDTYSRLLVSHDADAGKTMVIYVFGDTQ